MQILRLWRNDYTEILLNFRFSFYRQIFLHLSRSFWLILFKWQLDIELVKSLAVLIFLVALLIGGAVGMTERRNCFCS